MSKTRNNNKTSYSTGTRGESAYKRNQSGNHHGNRLGVTRIPSSGKK